MHTTTSPTTALLLIDLQRDFLGEDGRLPVAADQTEELLDAVARLTQHARLAGLPVAHVVNLFPRGSWLNFFRRYAAVEGTEGAALDDRAPTPRADEPVFEKSVSDAFSHPELASWLRERGVDRLVLCGVFANHCVASTAAGARNAGFAVTVVAEGVAAASDRARRRGLSKMGKRGCLVLTLDEVLAAIRVDGVAA